MQGVATHSVGRHGALAIHSANGIMGQYYLDDFIDSAATKVEMRMPHENG